MPMGMIIPPPIPCRTRKRMSCPKLWANPQAADAKVNRITVARNNFFVPQRSVAHPVIGITAPCASA